MGKISDFTGKITDRISGVYTKYNSAIIVAGGSGQRACTGGQTKQMTQLCGKEVVARTVSTFDSCDFINEIIIVAKADETELYKQLAEKYKWKKISAVVVGGDTRQESVINGFKAISDKSEYVYIHDAARCLVTKKIIRDVGHTACAKRAAYAAHRADDSVKLEDEGGIRSLDRDKVWLAQTPQVFMTELYRASAYTALKNGFTATDDVSVAEHAGFKPVPVECGKMNIKITHPCDFEIAKAILLYQADHAED